MFQESDVSSQRDFTSLASSQRYHDEIKWVSFCAVLLFQVFCLSVALGGPWREVLLFILLISLQTLSGAIVWCSSISPRKSFHIFEVLVFGFVASFVILGISQLILQPIIPKAHYFSLTLGPLVALIIGLSPRYRQHRFRIVHPDTSSFKFLLFPAPLALSFSVFELVPAYILPLFLFVLLERQLKSQKFFRNVWNLKLFVISGLIGIFSTFLFFATKYFRGTSPALGLVGDDELFDFAHSRGYTIWGISENINFAGDNIRLYKFVQVWLGTYLEGLPTSILLTSTVIPIILFSVIGLALWCLARTISSNLHIANIASVLVFVQASLPEPYMIERRPLYLMSVILIIFGIIIYRHEELEATAKFFPIWLVFSFGFFSSRIQYAAVFFLGFFLLDFYKLLKNKMSLRLLVSRFVAVGTGAAFAYIVFFRFGISNSTELSVFPLLNSVETLANSLGARVFLLISLLIFLKGLRSEFLIFLAIIVGASLLFLFTPRHETWRYSIEIGIIASAPLLSIAIAENWPRAKDKLLIATLIFSFGIGMMNRVAYDAVKWLEPSFGQRLIRALKSMTSEGWPQFALTLNILGLIFIVLSFLFAKKETGFVIGACFLAATSYFSGSLFAADFRAFTSSGEPSRKVLEYSPNQTTRWFEQSDYSEGLTFFVEESSNDDLFATNAHAYDEDYARYGSSLILTSLTGRRSFAEAPNFDRSPPRDPADEFYARIRYSLDFPRTMSSTSHDALVAKNVRWFIVDLERTKLRSWEPYATTRFINEKIAILELKSLG
jgi:hypothetical protein